MTFQGLKMNQPPVRIMEVVHFRNTIHFLLSFALLHVKYMELNTMIVWNPNTRKIISIPYASEIQLKKVTELNFLNLALIHLLTVTLLFSQDKSLLFPSPFLIH